MLRIKPLFILCAALLTAMPTASADVNSDMNQFFNKLGFASNTTQPGVWQGQAAGYAYGGSLYARTQVKNIQLISMTLPDINAGCGGIDAYLGSFSFINGDQLQRFVKQIMSNAAGYFFDLALQTTVPEIKTAKDFLQKMASDINSMNLSSCQVAQGLVGGLFPQTQESQQKVCQDIGSESNIFADWAASRQGCTVGGQSSSVRDKASDKDKERVLKNQNIIWEALKKNRMFDGNKELKEFIMTLTGTLIFGEDSEITPLPARTTDRDILRAIMEGGTAKIYHCNDSDKCLKVVADANVTIARDKALKSQITKLLTSIQNKAVSDTPLDAREQGFISSTTIRAYRDAADQRAETRTQAPEAVSQEGPDVQQAVTQAIAGLSERKVQFTYTDVLARTVGILPPENGVIERARAGIDEAISREQLIPLDREKGLFTSGIHVLDELSVRALSRDIMKQNRVTVHPEKSVPRTAGYSDAVSVLAQDRPSLAIVSGQGGAAGQRERVAELVMMAREQGREVQIIAADRRSQMNLKQDERLSGELITGRRQLQEGMIFTPGSTVIVDQGEKLSLKETLTLLDGAARHNVQVLITDSGQRTGTGSALMAMKDAGVNTYRWQGGEQRPATIISEPDRNVRYARLAGDFAASVKAGEESVAQVSGVREQAILAQAIRSELKTQGVLGHPEVTMTALSPVWLDSRSRYLRDMYRPGMVMEQWNPETRSHDRYVIDRVTAQSHSLTLRDAQGETQVVRISSLDSSWSLFRPEKMPVADGERLRVTGKIPGLRVSGGDRLQVASVSEDAMTVVVPGRAEAALPESVLRESQREREAVREVARENLLQERLQQMERDMVRDLQKEKTLGGD